MEKTFKIEDKEYVVNKRYPCDDEVNKVFYFKAYKNKDGEMKYYKYFQKNKGSKSTGRPKGTKNKLIEKIRELDDTKIELLYSLVCNNFSIKL